MLWFAILITRYRIILQCYKILCYAMKNLYDCLMTWFAALCNDAKFENTSLGREEIETFQSISVNNP